jgi:RimJ/RimL family protein N-acetyltransferase
MMHKQLFEGPMIRLAAIDPEKDGAVEAAWTFDLDYARDLRLGPARPLGALDLKKHYEGLEKKSEDGHQIYFAVRLKAEDRLVGFVRIPMIFWTHGAAIFSLSFVDTILLQCYGPETIELIFCYAFRELNLYRLETILPAYSTEAITLFEQAGFLMEVRRRQAIYRDGRPWDILHYGILQSEWKSREEEALAL